MASNDRSSSSSGGVKSLLAKFEAGQQTSAPGTPNARGRSPAVAVDSNGTSADSARPSSTVRTTFVPVERSVSTPKRKPTPSNPSTGSPSDSKNTPTSTDDTELDAGDLQTQAQAAIDSIAEVTRDNDNAAVGESESGPPVPPDAPASASIDVSTPAPASVAPVMPSTPTRGAQSVPGESKSKSKFSPSVSSDQTANSGPRETSPPALSNGNPKTPVKSSAPIDEPQHLVAPVEGSAGSKTLEKARAKSSAQRDQSMDRLSISPVPEFKSGAQPDIQALQEAQGRRPSLNLHISSDAEDVLGPRPSNPAGVRRRSDGIEPAITKIEKSKESASPTTSSVAKTASPSTSKPKTPITPKPNGTPSKTGPGSASKSGSSATKPGTNGVRKARGLNTPVQTGFHKPKPRSPTRPIKLPAHLVAPTAASAAKHGLQPAPETARSGRRGSSVSDIAPRRSTLRTSNVAPRRSSVKPKPPPAQRSPRASLPVRAPAESFLERMMRPTASSASKVHAKTDAATTPKRH